MIELLEGFPENVVAAAAIGHVTRRDYDDVLIPKVNAVLERQPNIRCYYELGARFQRFDAGAAWEDLRLGIRHLTQWERVAIVTDVEWIRTMVNVFRFLLPGEMRVYSTAQATDARAWISAS
jgi:hypothetical protein